LKRCDDSIYASVFKDHQQVTLYTYLSIFIASQSLQYINTMLQPPSLRMHRTTFLPHARVDSSTPQQLARRKVLCCMTDISNNRLADGRQAVSTDHEALPVKSDRFQWGAATAATSAAWSMLFPAAVLACELPLKKSITPLTYFFALSRPPVLTLTACRACNARGGDVWKPPGVQETPHRCFSDGHNVV